MTRITEAALTSAIQRYAGMDQDAREASCNELYMEQPNLLASVLVLTKMDAEAGHVGMALEALIVTHLALRESGERIRTISEEEHDRELQRLVETMNFSEGLDSAQLDQSIIQYVGFQEEPWLLAYVIARIQESGILSATSDDSKFLVLTVLNIVGCVAAGSPVATTKT